MYLEGPEAMGHHRKVCLVATEDFLRISRLAEGQPGSAPGLSAGHTKAGYSFTPALGVRHAWDPKTIGEKTEDQSKLVSRA